MEYLWLSERPTWRRKIHSGKRDVMIVMDLPGDALSWEVNDCQTERSYFCMLIKLKFSQKGFVIMIYFYMSWLFIFSFPIYSCIYAGKMSLKNFRRNQSLPPRVKDYLRLSVGKIANYIHEVFLLFLVPAPWYFCHSQRCLSPISIITLLIIFNGFIEI